jgi:hypothetical protein
MIKLSALFAVLCFAAFFSRSDADGGPVQTENYGYAVGNLTSVLINVTSTSNDFVGRTLLLERLWNYGPGGLGPQYAFTGAIADVAKSHDVLALAYGFDATHTETFAGSGVADTYLTSLMSIVLVPLATVFQGVQTAPVILGINIAQQFPGNDTTFQYDMTVLATNPISVYCNYLNGVNQTVLSNYDTNQIYSWIVSLGSQQGINCAYVPSTLSYDWTFQGIIYDGTNTFIPAGAFSNSFTEPFAVETLFTLYGIDPTMSFTMYFDVSVSSQQEVSDFPFNIHYSATTLLSFYLKALYPPLIKRVFVGPNDLIVDGNIAPYVNISVEAVLISLITPNGTLADSRGFTWTWSIPTDLAEQPYAACPSVFTSLNSGGEIAGVATGQVLIDNAGALALLAGLSAGGVVECYIKITVFDTYADPILGIRAQSSYLSGIAFEHNITTSNVEGLLTWAQLPSFSVAVPMDPNFFMGGYALFQAGGVGGIKTTNASCGQITNWADSQFNTGESLSLGWMPSAIMPSSCSSSFAGCPVLTACDVPAITVTCDYCTGTVPAELEGPCFNNVNGTCVGGYGIFFAINSTTDLQTVPCGDLNLDGTLTVTFTVTALRADPLQVPFVKNFTFTTAFIASCMRKRDNTIQSVEPVVVYTKPSAVYGNSKTQVSVASVHVSRPAGGVTQSIQTGGSGGRKRSAPTSGNSSTVEVQVYFTNNAVFAGFTNAELTALNATGGNLAAIEALLASWFGNATSGFLASTSQQLSLIFTVNLPTAAPTTASTAAPLTSASGSGSLKTQNRSLLDAVIALSVLFGMSIILFFVVLYFLLQGKSKYSQVGTQYPSRKPDNE